MDKDIIDETSELISDDAGDNDGNLPGYCPHCGTVKPVTERYCSQCGKDRNGDYAPYLAKVYSEAKKTGPAPVTESVEAERRQISGRAYAVAALVISLFNLFMTGTLLTPIALPLVIVFICKSAKRKGGKAGMAAAAIAVSVSDAILFSIIVYGIVKIYPDLKYISNPGEDIVREYDINGTIPERFDKYRDSKYDEFWDIMGYDDFDEFFENVIIENYRKNVLDGKEFGTEDSTEPSSDAETTTSESSTQAPTSKVYEEDLVNFA